MNERQAVEQRKARHEAAIQRALRGNWSSINHREKSEAERVAVQHADECYEHNLDAAGRAIADARAELNGELPDRISKAKAMPTEGPEQSAAKSAALTQCEARRVELSQLIAQGPERLAHAQTISDIG